MCFERSKFKLINLHLLLFKSYKKNIQKYILLFRAVIIPILEPPINQSINQSINSIELFVLIIKNSIHFSNDIYLCEQLFLGYTYKS